MKNTKLAFASDYQEGALPEVIDKLTRTNLEATGGYGTDPYCADAADRIRKACQCPEAAVHFLTGGTQTNQIMISTALAPWQGVIAAKSGHISLHEAGAIEYTGHKVIELPQVEGKLEAGTIRDYADTFFRDENREHMVTPGMVYISQPTEYGTLYSLDELKQIRSVCDDYGLLLYADGARLAYALASPGNDAGLPDLAELCDMFYIGGTKCGALFGEAVVIPKRDLIPHLFTMIKQRGALLAKGRMLGLQFGVLFTDDLYVKAASQAIQLADEIRSALREKGYRFFIETETNQIFIVISDEKLEAVKDRLEYSFWENYDDSHTVIRLATSWATTKENTKKLIALL